MRKIKKIEYRSDPTNIRRRVFIYVSLGRYSAKAEAEMMAEYGIKCHGNSSILVRWLHRLHRFLDTQLKGWDDRCLRSCFSS